MVGPHQAVNCLGSARAPREIPPTSSLFADDKACLPFLLSMAGARYQRSQSMSCLLLRDSRRAITLAFGLFPFLAGETVPQMAVFDEARQGVHDHAGT